MAEAAKVVTAPRKAAGEPGQLAPRTSIDGGTSVLDPAIIDVMRLSADLQRLTTRQHKTLWRKKGLSERGLYMLELVHAGLNRPSRLIEYFDVLPSTITFETDKLVASGLMVRESLPSDRRVVHLSLTDEGRAVHAEVTAALNALLIPRLRRLPPEELQAFLETFRKIVYPMEAPAAGTDEDQA